MGAEGIRILGQNMSMHMGGRGAAAKRGGEKGEHEETIKGTTLDFENQQKRRSLTEKSKEPRGTRAGLYVKLPKPAVVKPFRDVMHACND